MADGERCFAGLGAAAAAWARGVRAQMKGVAALLAWVVLVCAAIGLGGAWLYSSTTTTRIYLWGYCNPSLLDGETHCASFYDNDFLENFAWTPETTVLVLQAIALVLSFIGAIVASVGGCVSQPKGTMVASIVVQFLYLVISIAAWAYAISQMTKTKVNGQMVIGILVVKWSYGFALAIVGSILSLAVMALSAGAMKSPPPPQGAYGTGAPGNPVYGAQEPMAYAQVPGNPAGSQAMQKA